MTTLHVVILDAHLHSALSAVRSLGGRGIEVVCGSERSGALCFFSRYCSRSFVYYSPLKDQHLFVRDVIAYMNTLHGRILLYCFSETTLLPLIRSKNKRIIESLVIPSSESIEIAVDKCAIADRAQQLGLLVAERYSLNDADILSYPVIVRPRHSTHWIGHAGLLSAPVVVYGANELRRVYTDMKEKMGEEPFIQKIVEGGEYGFFAFCVRGRIKATFAHHRLRSLSPSGGASSFRESIVVPPKLLRHASKILRDLRWHGVAMVEFKSDSAFKKPYFIEINPRFWGSLRLSCAAGIDFPWYVYSLVCGNHIEYPSVYRVGIRARHFLADIVSLWRYFQKGTLTWRILGSFFCFISPTLYYDVFSCHDPLPFFAEIRDYVRRLRGI